MNFEFQLVKLQRELVAKIARINEARAASRKRPFSLKEQAQLVVDEAELEMIDRPSVEVLERLVARQSASDPKPSREIAMVKFGG